MRLTSTCALGILVAFSLAATAAADSEGGEQLVHGRWLGAMGASGLRRSLSNGSDFGDLINRSTSYKMAAQVDAMQQRQRAAGADLPPADISSEVDAWVAQSSSLIPFSTSGERKFLLSASLRRAERYEDERVDARSDRLELGVLTSTVPGYLGLSAVIEQSDAELGLVEGSRRSDGLGLRFDYGRVLNETWAVSGRLDHVQWEGDGETHIPSQAGTTVVYQDSSFTRDYVTVELIARDSIDLPLVGDTQLRWRSGVHYMRNGYDDHVNSLGQRVEEAFGAVEHLGLLKTSAYFAWSLGAERQWSPFVELTYDYELKNNMDTVIHDPHTLTTTAGLARLLKLGWRAQLDVKQYQSFEGKRTRNGATLVLIVDL